MDIKSEFQDPESLFLAPLGGLGEIGMNLMVLAYRGRALLIDCGATFPEHHFYGSEIVVPDICFLKESKLQIDAVILTHAHEDHIGAIALLYEELGKPPLTGAKFTLAMVEERLKQFSSFQDADWIAFEVNDSLQFGPFEVKALRVTHSIVESVGLAIRTPLGNIVHTGDFKIDREPVDGLQFDQQSFEQLGEEGTLLLMSDSTNAEQPGWTKPEAEVGSALQKLVCETQKGKIFIALFSSNILRLKQMMEIAENAGRKICLLGRSVLSNVEVATRLGHLPPRPELFVSARQAHSVPPEKLLVLATGSQAETRSALKRLSLGKHPELEIEEGDTVVFSSRHIPGNELAIARMMNALHRMGAHVCDTLTHPGIHSSGHARKEELRNLLKWVRPRFFLPVHGEYRMLVRHHELAQESLSQCKSLVAENGDLLRLRPDEFKKMGRIEHGKVYLDEFRQPISDQMLRDRKKLGAAGVAFVGLLIDWERGKLLEKPDLRFYGLTDELDLQELENAIEKHIEAVMREGYTGLDEVEKELFRFFRKKLKRATGLKVPVIAAVYGT